MIHAVIGIGSNSTRALVGSIEAGNVNVLKRLREGTRLFAGLQDGQLSEQSIMQTAMVVNRFVELAREMHAEDIQIIATSAARDALNSSALCEWVQALCGIDAKVLTGEEEAALSFWGCAGNGYCGMIDLGGGSTEIAVGGSNRPLIAKSVQVGAVRLVKEIPYLSGTGFEEAFNLCKNRVTEVWQYDGVHMPNAWYGVGGTLTCLASMDMHLAHYDREAVDGYMLTKDNVEKWAFTLSKMTLEEKAAIRGLQPSRADIIAHGAVALLGVLDGLGIKRVVVRSRSNLDGVLARIAGKQEQAATDAVQIVQSYYDASVEKEWSRLEKNYFEFEINKRYIDRYIKPGDRVLDAGGGPGRYSLHLASHGAEVVLLDLSPENILFAQKKAIEQNLSIETVCADARFLDEKAEGVFDAILLMGPLYHLTVEQDRVRTVQACLKKLKPGGMLYIAFISMVAGMIYAGRCIPESILWEGEDIFYEKMIAEDDFAGAAFTHAFFIAPKHVLPFMAQFQVETLHFVGSEGVCGPFNDHITAQSPEVRDKWLALSMALCEREDFRTYAEHLLYVGRKVNEGGGRAL